MSLLAHGLKLCLATLEALPQVSGSIRLFSEPSFQVAPKGFQLEMPSAGAV